MKSRLLDGQQERKRAKEAPRTMKEFLERGGFSPEAIPAFGAKPEQVMTTYSLTHSLTHSLAYSLMHTL